MMKSHFTSKKKGLIIIIAAVVGWLIVSMLATKWIYDDIFSRVEVDTATPPTVLSAMVENRETHHYPSDKHHLTGYLYRCPNNTNQNALVVLAPGYGAVADSYWWQIHSFLEYGWSVFAFDMTGCGASGGKSTVGFSQVLLDMNTTIDYVNTNARFGYDEVVLFGHSCGGYAACCALASQSDIAAVVTVSGVNSAMEGVLSAATRYVGPLAYGNYGPLWLYQATLFGAETVNLSADKILSNSDIPVLVIHGEEDIQVPVSRYSIYSHKDNIVSDKVQYCVRSAPDQSGHSDLLFDADGTANREVMETIHTFLRENIG